MRKFKNIFNTRLNIIMFIACMIAVTLSVGTYLCNVADEGTAVIVCMAIGMGMIGNIEATSDKDSAGAQITSKIYLIHLGQIDSSVPFPTPVDGTLGTIPLASGEKMYYFDTIPDSQEDKSSGSKGDVTTEVKNDLTFIIGGNKHKALKFLEEFAGERFIVIYQTTDRKYWVLGNDLKPMILMNFERVANKSQRSISFTFENTSFEQPKEYVGTIVAQDAQELTADATTLTVTTADLYKTNYSNTKETVIDTVAGLTSTDVGRVITIKGGGGTYPGKVKATDSVILKDDETWVGTLGSMLTLKVLDVNTLVEQSRS